MISGIVMRAVKDSMDILDILYSESLILSFDPAEGGSGGRVPRLVAKGGKLVTFMKEGGPSGKVIFPSGKVIFRSGTNVKLLSGNSNESEVTFISGAGPAPLPPDAMIKLKICGSKC